MFALLGVSGVADESGAFGSHLGEDERADFVIIPGIVQENSDILHVV